MTDTRQQYEWAQAGGFHAQLIPAIIAGAIMGAALFFLIGLAILHVGGTIAIIIGIVLGVPVGAFCGYLTGLGLGKNRLKWVKWAEERGWNYTANPEAHVDLGLRHMQQVKQSSIYWSHARKKNLLTRLDGDRHACIHTSSSMSHLDLKHDSQYSNNSKSAISIFLLLDIDNECPEMIIHARSLADRLKLPSRLEMVQFESTEFNEKWTVRARDPKSAYDRLGQKALEFLLGQDSEFIVELNEGLLIIQYRLLDRQTDTFSARPRPYYERVISFAEHFTRAVPDDLLKPITLTSR